jgi:hypothetical protein
MCQISGIAVLDGHESTITEQKMQALLSHLLSPAMVAYLRVISEELEFVEKLTQTIETPESIWNAQTLSELRQYVRTHLQHLRSGAAGDEPDMPDFSYQCLADEVRVGSIFLRLYIQHPEWPIGKPREFLQALLTLLQRQPRTRPVSLATRITMLSVVQFCASHQGYEDLLVTPDALDCLFWLFPSSGNTAQREPDDDLKPLQDVALNVVVLATANKLCVDAVCNTARLRALLACIDNSSSQRMMVLSVLENMLAGSARAAPYLMASGAIAYLLEIVTMAVGAKSLDISTRALAVQVLRQATILYAKAVSSSSSPSSTSPSSPNVSASSSISTSSTTDLQVLLGAIWPPYVCAMLQRAPTEFISFYDHDFYNPDLIWNNANRLAAKDMVQQLAQYARSLTIQAPAFDATPMLRQPVDYVTINGIAQCGNVYASLVPHFAQYPLHNVRWFISSAMQCLAAMVKDMAQQQNVIYELISAIYVTIQQKTEWYAPHTHTLSLSLCVIANGIDDVLFDGFHQ